MSEKVTLVRTEIRQYEINIKSGDIQLIAPGEIIDVVETDLYLGDVPLAVSGKTTDDFGINEDWEEI